MKHHKRLMAIPAVAVAVLALTAASCEKQPPTTDPAWAWQVAGDSITLQTIVYGGDMHGAQTENLVGNGWQAKDAQPQLTNNVYTPGHSPAIFAMAFGWNYAAAPDAVFGEAEANQLFEMAFSPEASACVVIVLPGGRPDREITQVRTGLTALHQARLDQGLRSALVDWQPTVNQHPEYIVPDGLHLSNVDVDQDGRWDSAVAFADMLESGRQDCLGQS